jgi:hypothetical protein
MIEMIRGSPNNLLVDNKNLFSHSDRFFLYICFVKLKIMYERKKIKKREFTIFT